MKTVMYRVIVADGRMSKPLAHQAVVTAIGEGKIKPHFKLQHVETGDVYTPDDFKGAELDTMMPVINIDIEEKPIRRKKRKKLSKHEKKVRVQLFICEGGGTALGIAGLIFLFQGETFQATNALSAGFVSFFFGFLIRSQDIIAKAAEEKGSKDES